MTFIFLTASFIIPFMAEWFAAPKGGASISKRSPLFYALVPAMGVIVYIAAMLITGREWLGLLGSVLFYGGLTAISNKKFEVLKTPFNAHDFDNLRNLYIYPEFYVSYVGWPVLLCVSSVFLGLLWLAIASEAPLALYGYFPAYTGWPIMLVLWFFFIKLTRRLLYRYFNEMKSATIGLTFDLTTDIQKFGLFPTVFLYRLLIKEPCIKPELKARTLAVSQQDGSSPADIIAIQGESYFDLRRIFEHLPESVSRDWPSLSSLEQARVQTGRMTVPAWGAYTMQTEFSFLTGIPNSALGVDRINPYMRFSQTPITTLVRALKEAGYRTLCIHPAKKEFFRRADVMPNLGFDDFIGLEAFSGAPYYGKYIADSALAEKIEHTLAAHHANYEGPIFIFAITIESHGPWADGRLAEHLDERALVAENPTGDLAFALYQRHMENLLTLYRKLSVESPSSLHPRVTALYGDHMPALAPLFDALGFQDETVDYLIWSSKGANPAGQQRIEGFGKHVLMEAGLNITGL